MKLDAPVHFFARPQQFWPEILSGPEAAGAITDAELAQRCVGAINNWVMQAAALFARHGLPYTAGPVLRQDAINIVSGIDFSIRARDVHSYVLAMRADGPLSCVANFVGEQNGLGLPRTGAAHFAHMPQPGIIPRDAARGNRLENISFKGAEENLAQAFRSQAFRDRLAERNVTLRLDLRIADGKTRLAMHDYSDVDAVLAVRNLTLGDYYAKPASKLVNCWLAGVPAILGPEPAFRELRRSPLDFIEVRDPGESIAALDLLRSDPGLYRAMVENGQARAVEHNQTAVLSAWIDLLNGPVRESFEKWQARPRVYRLGRWPIAAVRQKLARRRAIHIREHGPRGPGVG